MKDIRDIIRNNKHIIENKEFSLKRRLKALNDLCFHQSFINNEELKVNLLDMLLDNKLDTDFKKNVLERFEQAYSKGGTTLESYERDLMIVADNSNLDKASREMALNKLEESLSNPEREKRIDKDAEVYARGQSHGWVNKAHATVYKQTIETITTEIKEFISSTRQELSQKKAETVANPQDITSTMRKELIKNKQADPAAKKQKTDSFIEELEVKPSPTLGSRR